ncbi:MAG TPA: helix-turn-helix domain-containing protein, partial [Herpetosiphonaceae bacterium]|nr:helix-turn-helix domain-containing protein [Herpetosiphonaceae bacterium]
MPAPKSPEHMPDFGALLRYLRRRARLTQRDLAIATGYSESQICRLEQNKRAPDLSALMALFVPALAIDDKPDLIARLIELAALAREDGPGVTVVSTTRTETTVSEVLGAVEEPPPPPALLVDRNLAERLLSRLEHDQRMVIYGLPGVGKTTLAAQMARAYPGPVFWLTLTAGVTASGESLLRQLALFLLTQGCDVRALLPGIGEPALPLEQQITLLGQGLAQLAERGAPALLGLDNAQLAGEDRAMVTTLQHLLATAPLRLLLTSRTALGWGEAVHVPLSGMEAAEARRLIGQFAADLEPDLAERLVERTDGNPMVLRLALGALPAAAEARREFVESLDSQAQIGEYLL